MPRGRKSGAGASDSDSEFRPSGSESEAPDAYRPRKKALQDDAEELKAGYKPKGQRKAGNSLRARWQASRHQSDEVAAGSKRKRKNRRKKKENDSEEYEVSEASYEQTPEPLPPPKRRKLPKAALDSESDSDEIEQDEDSAENLNDVTEAAPVVKPKTAPPESSDSDDLPVASPRKKRRAVVSSSDDDMNIKKSSSSARNDLSSAPVTPPPSGQQEDRRSGSKSDSDSDIPRSQKKRRTVIDESSEPPRTPSPKPVDLSPSVRRSGRKQEKQNTFAKARAELAATLQNDNDEDAGIWTEVSGDSSEDGVVDDSDSSLGDGGVSCVCGSDAPIKEYIGATVKCRKCERSFHAVCVGVEEEQKWRCRACRDGEDARGEDEAALYDGIERSLPTTEDEIFKLLSKFEELDGSAEDSEKERAKLAGKLRHFISRKPDFDSLLPEAPYPPLSHMICYAPLELLPAIFEKAPDLELTDVNNISTIPAWLDRLLQTLPGEQDAVDRFSEILFALVDFYVDDKEGLRELLVRPIRFEWSAEPHTVLSLAASLRTSDNKLLRRILSLISIRSSKTRSKILKHQYPLHAAPANLNLVGIKALLASRLFTDDDLPKRDPSNKTVLHRAVSAALFSPSEAAFDVVREVAKRVAKLGVDEDRTDIPSVFIEKSFYHQKQLIKSLGGRWSVGMRRWYIPPEADVRPFIQYGFVTAESRQVRLRQKLLDISVSTRFPIDAKDGEGMTAFHYAAGAELESDRLLWGVDGTNPPENDLLEKEASFQVRLANLLYECGADHLMGDSMGATALHFAAVNSDVDLVRFLLSLDVPADIKDSSGWTPLLYAHMGEVERHREEGNVGEDGSILTGTSVDSDCIVELINAKPDQLEDLHDLLYGGDSEDRPIALVEKEQKVAKALLLSLATKPPCFRALNEYIRGKPDLIASFAAVPGLLDLNNRLDHFYQQIPRFSYGMQHLAVQRGNEFLSAFASARFLGGEPLDVQFVNDAGVCLGPKREFFNLVLGSMIKLEPGVFTEREDGTVWFCDGPSTEIQRAHARFAGQLCARAITERVTMSGVRFAGPVFKVMIGSSELKLEDFEQIDPELFRSWSKVLEPGAITGYEGFTFSVSDETGKEVELVPGGSDKEVTEANKEAFINLWVKWKLERSAALRLAFQQGFHSLIPQRLVANFQSAELDLLLFGLPEFDLEDWKKHTVYDGVPDRLVKDLWRLLGEMNSEDRSLLLRFWTGVSSPPAAGFGSLATLGSEPGCRVIAVHGMSTSSLPMASTCFNMLRLPLYDDYAQLRDKLFVAIRYGSSGFSFA